MWSTSVLTVLELIIMQGQLRLHFSASISSEVLSADARHSNPGRAGHTSLDLATRSSTLRLWLFCRLCYYRHLYLWCCDGSACLVRLGCETTAHRLLHLEHSSHGPTP